MSQLTKQYFDSHAVTFDSIYLNESRLWRWLNGLLRKAVYERFRIALQASGDVSGKTILDIGCGSGRYAVEYARRGARRVVGVDLAPNMLALAKRLAEQEGVQAQCSFLPGEFTAIEFDEQFDIVLAMGVFDYVVDAPSFLRAMKDRSQDLIIASFPGKSVLRMRFRQWRYRLQHCPVFFYSEPELHNLARAANLQDYRLVFMPYSGTGYVLIGQTRH